MRNFNFDRVSIDRIINNDYYDDINQDSHSDRDNSIVHDDGWMHIHFNGRVYSFDIGQDRSNRDYNQISNSIIRDIGIIGRVSGNNN